MSVLLLILAGAAAGALLLIVYHRYRRLRPGRIDLNHLITQDQYEYILIDIRSPVAYRAGHIPTAVNVPAAAVDDYVPSENMFVPIVVYGSTRIAARRAVRTLGEAGYFNVSSHRSWRTWKGPRQTDGDAEEPSHENRRTPVRI